MCVHAETIAKIRERTKQAMHQQDVVARVLRGKELNKPQRPAKNPDASTTKKNSAKATPKPKPKAKQRRTKKVLNCFGSTP